MARPLGQLLQFGMRSRFESVDVDYDQLAKDLEIAKTVQGLLRPDMSKSEMSVLTSRLESISTKSYSPRLRLESVGFKSDYQTLKYRTEGMIDDIIEKIIEFFKNLFGFGGGGGGGGGGSSSSVPDKAAQEVKKVSTTIATVVSEPTQDDQQESPKPPPPTPRSTGSLKEEVEVLKKQLDQVKVEVKKRGTKSGDLNLTEGERFSWDLFLEVSGGRYTRVLEDHIKMLDKFYAGIEKGDSSKRFFDYRESGVILTSHWKSLTTKVDIILKDGEVVDRESEDTRNIEGVLYSRYPQEYLTLVESSYNFTLSLNEKCEDRKNKVKDLERSLEAKAKELNTEEIRKLLNVLREGAAYDGKVIGLLCSTVSLITVHSTKLWGRYKKANKF